MYRKMYEFILNKFERRNFDKFSPRKLDGGK